MNVRDFLGFLYININILDFGNTDEHNSEESDEESDGEMVEGVNVSSDDDPEWSCELDGFESSDSESDDDNDKAESKSRNHIRCVMLIIMSNLNSVSCNQAIMR